MKDLDIEEDFVYLKSMSENKFKNLVKRKMKEVALDDLNEKKFVH